ncbi:MAG: hypothetical protein KDK39_14930 [Leptospiraceae bacterium]|nr:hypothetical protein [Leptospiraceae bacterium]
MKKGSAIITGLIVMLFTLGIQAEDNYMGTYLRENGETVNVRLVGDKLFCTIVSNKFEMCNGMRKVNATTYKGAKMKHPMFSLKDFDGTVIFSASGLSIEGCAMFGSVCDKETWKKK